jgi:hypothetical protein
MTCELNEEMVIKKIMAEIYIACENLGAASELLTLIGSFGDTQKNEDILHMLSQYNKTGTYIDEMLFSVTDTPEIRRNRFKLLNK